MVYVNEKLFIKYDKLYIVENLMKSAIQGFYFRKQSVFKFFKLLVNHPLTTCKMKRMFKSLQKIST